jgi:hypothetical protein
MVTVTGADGLLVHPPLFTVTV